MVKAYLRYEAANTFGVVASAAGNMLTDHAGKLLISPALEATHVWNPKTGALVRTLTPEAGSSGEVGEVTRLARSPTSNLLAVGHNDGAIRIWNYQSGDCLVTFNGHKTAVSALRYNGSGEWLASGGKDTDVVLWDVVGEAGLCRLRGHRDQVTDVVFVERHKRLVSCSKDTLVRVWDLHTQHCVQTVVGHRAEVWALAVDPSERRLVTGSVDNQLRVYALDAPPGSRDGGGGGGTEGAAVAAEGVVAQGAVAEEEIQVMTLLGSVTRVSTDRVASLDYDAAGTMLGCMGVGKALEVYKVRSEAEVQKKLKRRKKRQREKGKEDAADDADDTTAGAADEFQLLQTLRLKAKARSFAFLGAADDRRATAAVAVALHNNTLEVHELSGADSTQRHAVDLPGHRHDVRSLALSSDDQMLLSTSHSGAKIWNPRSGACLRTVETGYGLCSMFVPGNRHAVVGTKAGTLELLDVGSATRYHVEADAHEGAVWSLAGLADESGFVSASADKTVKFWEYELETDDDGQRQLMIRHTRTLQMAEDILSVRFDPKGRLLAVALLDSTIKVFFTDSLKFFLSLYGHKLPALTLDISSDGTLLASGSADKNIKIWGLDFGDCHKSIFAHQDSVMQVRWVRKTHYLWSVGKDKVLKYWDCDKFEPLLTLRGHKSEIWALTVSSYGDFVVTGGHDRSIRRWERTEEPFFLEEEQEKRLESLFEEGLDRDHNAEGDPVDGKTAAAAARSLDTVAAADDLVEALELIDQETLRLDEFYAEQAMNSAMKGKQPPPNPLMLGMTKGDFMLRALESVKPAELEQTILILPFTTALSLVPFLVEWLQERKQVEKVCRVACLLVRVHQAALSSTPAARATLLELRAHLRPAVQRLKDSIGFNLAAVKQLQGRLEAKAAF